MLLETLKNYLEALKTGYLGIPVPESAHEKIVLAYAKRIIAEIDKILESGAASDKALVRGFDAFLKNNAELINTNLLFYTNNTTPEINDLIYAIAVFVYERGKERGDKRPLISILLPHLKGLYPLDPLKEMYPALDSAAISTLEALRRIMQTHILGEAGHYLLPAKLILNDKGKWHNAYYDLFESEDMPQLAWVSEDEKKRVIAHSAQSQLLHYAREKKHRVEEDSSNFLGHLNRFIKALKSTSIAGEGKEYRASDKSFKIIYDFFVYYDALQEEKDKIPKEVQIEIDKIRHYSGETASFVICTLNGQKVVLPNVDSCSHTRYAALEQVKREYEDLLLTIACDETFRQGELKKAKEELHDYKSDFIKAYDGGEYQGKDTLGFNLALLRALKIDLSFDSFQAVYALKDFSLAELTEILLDEEQREEIVNAIGSIDNLLILSLALSHEKLRALLTSIEVYLPFEKIGDDPARFPWDDESRILRDELTAFLIPLDEERACITINVLSLLLKKSFISAENFHFLCHSQSGHVRRLCYTLFKDDLIHWIDDAEALENVLSALEPDDIRDLCPSLQSDEDLREVTPDSAESYAILFCELSPDQIQAYLDVFTEDFYKIVLAPLGSLETFISETINDDESELDDILHERNEPVEAVYGFFKDKLTDEQTIPFLHCLSAEVVHEVYDSFKRKGIMSICTQAETFTCFYDALSEEDKADCYSEVNDKLWRLIFSSSDFKVMMTCIGPDKAAEQISRLDLGSIIALVQSTQSIREIVPFLPEEQKWEFIKETLQKKPDLIETISNLVDVLEVLPEEKSDDFRDAISEQLSRLTINADEQITNLTRPKFFVKLTAFVVKWLPYILENNMPAMPLTGLKYFFSYFYQHDLFISSHAKKAYENKLQDPHTLVSFTHILSDEDLAGFITLFHDFLVNQLKEQQHLGTYLTVLEIRIKEWNNYSSYSNISMRNILVQLKPVFNDVINSADELITLLSTTELDYKTKAIIFELLFDKLKDMPMTIEQFNTLFYVTPTAMQYDLLRAFGGRLAIQVESIDDFSLLTTWYRQATWDPDLSQHKRKRLQKVLFDNLNPLVSTLIHSPDSLNSYLKLFNTYSVQTALSKLPPSVLELESWEDVFVICKGLDELRAKQVLKKISCIDVNKNGFQLIDFIQAYNQLGDFSDIERKTLVLKYQADSICALFTTHEAMLKAVTELKPVHLKHLLLFFKKHGLLDRSFMISLVDSLYQSYIRSQKDVSYCGFHRQFCEILSEHCFDECIDLFKHDNNPSHDAFYVSMFHRQTFSMWKKMCDIVNDPVMRYGDIRISKSRLPQNQLYYQLWQEIDILGRDHPRIAVEIKLTLKEIVDDCKEQKEVLREALNTALHDPGSALYKALNTHTSKIPLTLYSTEGRFGFFSQETNTLRRVREASEDESALSQRAL